MNAWEAYQLLASSMGAVFRDERGFGPERQLQRPLFHNRRIPNWVFLTFDTASVLPYA